VGVSELAASVGPLPVRHVDLPFASPNHLRDLKIIVTDVVAAASSVRTSSPLPLFAMFRLDRLLRAIIR
jgi:hypothetical protein